MSSFLKNQGQIKTGAPCRSERLAKYNQVNSLSFKQACVCLSLNDNTSSMLSLVVNNLLNEEKFSQAYSDIILVLFSASSFCVSRRSLVQMPSMQEQASALLLNPIKSLSDDSFAETRCV